MYDLSLVLNYCKAFLLWKFRTCSRSFSKAAVNSAPITIAAFSYQLVSGIFLVIKSRSSHHFKVRKRAIGQSSMLHSQDQMCHSVDCKTIVITLHFLQEINICWQLTCYCVHSLLCRFYHQDGKCLVYCNPLKTESKLLPCSFAFSWHYSTMPEQNLEFTCNGRLEDNKFSYWLLVVQQILQIFLNS